MAKKLNTFYKPTTKDEKKVMDIMTDGEEEIEDRNGNGDEVFKASNVKTAPYKGKKTSDVVEENCSKKKKKTLKQILKR